MRRLCAEALKYQMREGGPQNLRDRSSDRQEGLQSSSGSASILAQCWNGVALALASRMPDATFVYILQSEADPSRYYTGSTTDLAKRLAAHNNGFSVHTADGRPWRVIVSIEFADENKAAAFERYLKSGSGRAFANRHFR